MANIRVVTIDGPSGSGKTTLANDLRARFRCAVLDVGPLFRFVAWLATTNESSDVQDASRRLQDELLPSGRVKIGLFRGTNLSATGLEFDGREISRPLWDPNLDLLIRAASESAVVGTTLRAVARKVIGSSRAIVVGRNTSVSFFPEAAIQVRLEASRKIREQRKLRQVEHELQSDPESAPHPNFERAEPKSFTMGGRSSLSIDTSVLDPKRVGETVAQLIHDELHWEEAGLYNE